MISTVKKPVENGVDLKKEIAPKRWGIPKEIYREIRKAFIGFFLNFHQCFATRTCNNWYLAKEYILGLITMKNNRNFANIAREFNGVRATSDNLQHFMSNSPWSPQPAFDKIQKQIAADDEFNGGILTIDETGDRRNSENCAGASSQYWGRHRKKEIVQTGVCLGYYNRGCWTMLSGELYMAEKWFTDEYGEARKKLGVPEDRKFITKPKMALGQVKRAVENGIKCEVVVGDTNYGRDSTLRKELDDMNLIYLLDVPAGTLVYSKKPRFRKPKRKRKKRGKKSHRKYYPGLTLNRQDSVKVEKILELPDFKFQAISVRNTERGILENDFYACRVWVLGSKGDLTEVWLLIRKQKNGRIHYSLCNAPEDTSLEQLALWKCNRYFIERIFEDAKSELGWDELEARKYRSWDHHTALTAVALWFITSLKLDWKRSHPADPELAKEFQVEVLPNLSTANVRELFRCAFEMSRFDEEEIRMLVANHLENRARSTASRLRNQKKGHVDSS